MTPRHVATGDVRDHVETTSQPDRPFRIGVVSPFLDKTHGTERCVVEQIERLARDHACEIVVYCNDVRDLALSREEQDSKGGRITWRKVPNVPGPQLIRFSWWILANHLVRWWDRRSGEFTPDLLYSPGINCLDANMISVHIVFAEFHARVREQLMLRRNPIVSWPRLLHRRVYYRLIMALERGIYRREQIPLAGVSKKVADDLERIYGRKQNVSVIYHGVDARQFNPEVRSSLRCRARRNLGLPDSANALLLVGNDWKKKGLQTLLGAMARIRNPSLWALIVGRDDPAPYREALRANDLQHRVLFLPLRSDVEWYYAAADLYIGPSLEDAFALPPLEAMACGIPVVVSRQAGISEILTHGVDGLILDDPADSDQLAGFVEKLVSQPEFSVHLGKAAASTALKYTWQRNADKLFGVLLEARYRFVAG
jgi:glycosyltransferase involved in cell wall biosynthesis